MKKQTNKTEHGSFQDLLKGEELRVQKSENEMVNGQEDNRNLIKLP